MTLSSSDLPKPLAGVAGGFGDVDLPGAVVEGFEDRDVEGFTGRIGACSVAAHRGGELRQVIHDRKGSTLAKGLDKRSRLANTIGMMTTQINSTGTITLVIRDGERIGRVIGTDKFGGRVQARRVRGEAGVDIRRISQGFKTIAAAVAWIEKAS